MCNGKIQAVNDLNARLSAGKKTTVNGGHYSQRQVQRM